MKFKSFLILIILLLVIIIFIQNTEVVKFQIYFWQIRLSRIILFLTLLIIGFIAGYITAKLHRRKRIQQQATKNNTERLKGK
ncbi:MAG: DUF1049 domain-containing protein [Armatimonadetes bacterium]|nr:DUF1049 domain-containing protein [Armatimonadota bacterium]